MGQQLTRLPDLPGPELKPPRSKKVPSGYSKRKSHSKVRSDGRPTSRYTHHIPSFYIGGSSARGRNESRTEGSSRQLTGKTRAREHNTSVSNSRPKAKQNRTKHPSLEHSHHRNRKAEPRRHHTKSTAEPRKTQIQATYVHSRSPSHNKRKSNTISKSKLRPINTSVTSLRDGFTKQDCMICCDTKPLYRFPSRRPTAQCRHDIQTCRKCLRHWITTQYSSKLWDQIDCPECGIRMRYDDIKEFASKEIFKRYDEMSMRKAMEAIPGFRWCIMKGCKSGQVHDEERGGRLVPRFKCNGCGKSHCVIHGVKWHKGETCAEYDYRTDDTQRKAEDAASRKLIKDTAKKCPGCKWNIEKNEGCNHMTCSKCKHEFCWSCLASYGRIRKQGNQMHRVGCEYYDDGTTV